MREAYEAARAESFRRDYLLWLVVRHFLPAGLMRELAMALVSAASAESLTLQALFEETVPTGNPDLSTWVVMPKRDLPSFSDYLHRVVLAIVWQGDQIPHGMDSEFTPQERKVATDIALALQISTAGLADTGLDQAKEKMPEPLRQLAEVMIAHGDPTHNQADVADLGDDMPLKAMLTKHLGDLHADADQWDKAQIHYRFAETMLEYDEQAHWSELTRSLRAIITQSLGAASRILEGPEASSRILLPLVFQNGLDETPAVRLNAAIDVINDEIRAGNYGGAVDFRANLLWPPQLSRSHRLESALDYSLGGHFHDAHRWYWAVLRRQAALGSSTDVRATRLNFSRSILKELRSTVDRRLATKDFRLAVQMLLQSGQPTKDIADLWDEALVSAYVDVDEVEEVTEIAFRFAGCIKERAKVLVDIFEAWLKLLLPERETVARALLSHVARMASPGEIAAFIDHDVSMRALKALNAVGQARPEFRQLAGEHIGKAVSRTIETFGQLHVNEALDLALTYIDDLESDELAALLHSLFRLIEERLTEREAPWPIVHALIRLLTSRAVKRRGQFNKSFEQQRIGALVRFGLNSEAEHAELLRILGDADPANLPEALDRARLEEVVSDLMVKACDPRSSGAVADISALLAAPAIAGAAGVRAALDGLTQMLQAAAQGRVPIAFGSACFPLLQLAQTREKIETAFGDAPAFNEVMQQLFRLTVQLWARATTEPTIFASFSIPPREVPDRVTVHNWTFASLDFARMLGEEDAMADALAPALAHDALRDAMSIARAARLLAHPQDAVDLTWLHSETRDAFYAALGQRLSAMQDLTQEARKSFIGELLARTMEVGPRGEDAAVLLAAAQAGCLLDPGDRPVAIYRERISKDLRLQFSLGPFLLRLIPESLWQHDA
jgi:hypothetical protein